MNQLKFAVVVASSLSGPAFADAVVMALSSTGGHVAITHDGVDWWKVQDRTCVFQSAKNIACGTVTKVQPKGAVVRLDQPSYQIQVGNVVKKSFGRAPASVGPLSDSDDALILEKSKFNARPKGLFNLTVGLAGGAGFFFPQVQLQVGVGRHLSLGVGSILYSASAGDLQKSGATTQSTSPRSSLSGLGALATLTGHFSSRYAGFNVTGGAGLVKMTLTATGTPSSAAAPTLASTSPILLLTAGLRFIWANALNLGVAAGATRTVMPNVTSATDATETGIQPLLLVDVGFNF